ncbi:winged helix-turn-helix transcriptional regulator [Mucilaginibacter sp. 22184]|uniref:winged helix-turn-helix transcriptional regulator n=1 Tax=Mucilaginibacter sp. 22184 TaxID=3453887 RepID=UPI003F842E08
MYERKIPLTLGCGFELVRQVVNGKWKFMLLYCLHEGITRPSAMERALPGISRRVINIQLNQLIGHGLVSKQDYEEMPPRVEYFLTDLGKSLIPFIIDLGTWGEEHKGTLQLNIV